MAPKDMFTVFQKLPVEIRLKIWAMASNQEPRTLDIWTDYHRCEQNGIIFYAQKYESLLANKSPPAVLHTSREAREEALKHYTLEFRTIFPTSTGITQSFEARFYVNYASDTLVPRGYWNTIAFFDLMIRRSWGKLGHLAIDVTGSFWKHNIIEYIAKNEWVFEGVHEIILYNASEMPLFKKGDNLEDFKRSHRDGPRQLSFVKAKTTGKLLDDAEALLAVYFDKMDGKAADLADIRKGGKAAEVLQDETSGAAADEEDEKATEQSDEEKVQDPDIEEDIQTTRIRIKELVASIPTIS